MRRFFDKTGSALAWTLIVIMIISLILLGSQALSLSSVKSTVNETVQDQVHLNTKSLVDTISQGIKGGKNPDLTAAVNTLATNGAVNNLSNITLTLDDQRIVDLGSPNIFITTDEEGTSLRLSANTSHGSQSSDFFAELSKSDDERSQDREETVTEDIDEVHKPFNKFYVNAFNSKIAKITSNNSTTDLVMLNGWNYTGGLLLSGSLYCQNDLTLNLSKTNTNYVKKWIYVDGDVTLTGIDVGTPGDTNCGIYATGKVTLEAKNDKKVNVYGNIICRELVIKSQSDKGIYVGSLSKTYLSSENSIRNYISNLIGSIIYDILSWFNIDLPRNLDYNIKATIQTQSGYYSLDNKDVNKSNVSDDFRTAVKRYANNQTIVFANVSAGPNPVPDKVPDAPAAPAFVSKINWTDLSGSVDATELSASKITVSQLQAGNYYNLTGNSSYSFSGTFSKNHSTNTAPVYFLVNKAVTFSSVIPQTSSGKPRIIFIINPAKTSATLTVPYGSYAAVYGSGSNTVALATTGVWNASPILYGSAHANMISAGDGTSLVLQSANLSDIITATSTTAIRVITGSSIIITPGSWAIDGYGGGQ